MDASVARGIRLMSVTLLLGVASAAGNEPAGSTAVRFGELPDGAVAIGEMTDVRTEICRDLLLDPRQIVARPPKGYRLLTAQELAAREQGVAQLTRREEVSNGRPSPDQHVVGSLCFVAAGSVLIDGVRVQGADPMPMAFLWARAEGTPDAKMLGTVQWVQLASWYPIESSEKARILASDPTAEFVPLEVRSTSPTQWSLHLELPTEQVSATITGSGLRVPRKAPQPGFMSVAMNAAGKDWFQVFTYFGHHSQDATGRWNADGSGMITSAFAIPGQDAAFATLMQDGWQARFGLYAFEDRVP